MTAPPYVDHRRNARFLYWQGWRCVDIADALGLPRTTVESWKGRDGWDDAPVISRVESSIEARLVQLVLKDQKTGSDYKELDLLGRQIERLARVRRYEQPGGHEGDLNPNIERRNAGPKRRPARNEFSEEQQARLIALFDEQLFGYQRRWREAAFAIVAFAGSALLNLATKQFFQRQRPELWDSIAPEYTFSFPSGHAMGSMTLAAVVVLFEGLRQSRVK